MCRWNGAPYGSRDRISSLEGWHSAFELTAQNIVKPKHGSRRLFGKLADRHLLKSLVRHGLDYPVFLEIQNRAHQLRIPGRRRLRMLEPLVARLPRDVKPPFMVRTPFEHQRPRPALRNVQIMLLRRLREPYALRHAEEIPQGIENSAHLRPLLVSGTRRQRRIQRRDVFIFAFQDSRKQISRMIVEKPAIVALQPMMYPHGKTEEYERPPYQIRIFGIAELFGPSNLEKLRKPPRIRRTSRHGFFPLFGAEGWTRTCKP